MPSGGNGERPAIPAEVSAGAAAEIARLVAAGDYQGAAKRAAAAGDLRRAIALCERIWRFADAIPWALELGDYPLAVRLCLDAGAPARAREVVSQLLDGPASDSTRLLAVADVLARRGLVLDAAALALRAGAPTRAAELFHAGGAFVEAARARIAAGAFADAGRLLEEVAGAAALQGEIAEEAEARLELGILCGRLGRFRDGARALQIAARHPPLRTIALAHLETQLASLDLPHAAAAVREELRQRPSSPVSVAGEIGAATGKASGASGARQANVASSAPATPAPASSPLPALPRFADLALIGGGRLGRVFRARDRLLGETVVLKVMGVGVSGHGQEQQAFRQFLLQAEASSRLRHPNIVRLIDVDERAGLLVMEYVPGGTLADRLARQGRLRPALVRRLALDLLAALAAAHRAGIVHRDVKPPNVFLDAAGNAKLADFGAAHLADFGGTQTAGFIGTLGYLSPEQIAGGRIGPAADLYALGATLFEALVGRLPFVAGDIAGQHLGAPPPRPSTLAPELDPRHDEVLLRALAKTPADRFASADDMAAAIRAWPAALAEPAVARAIPREPEPAAAPGAHATPAPLPAATLVGATATGQLWSRIDDRLGAPVLVEVLHSPLDEAGIERIGRIAAAGGPYVQRVLRLEDPATIVYEALVGPLVALDSLPPEEQALLAAPLVSLAPCGIPSASPAMIVSTRAGPVIPVVVLVGPA